MWIYVYLHLNLLHHYTSGFTYHEILSEIYWNNLKFSQDFAKLFRKMFEEANSEFLDHKSAEKFVSFDQINYKRVLETESFKERRIGEFFLTTTYLCDSEI